MKKKWMDWIGYQPNSSLGYCANKTKQNQIQLTGWNYFHQIPKLATSLKIQDLLFLRYVFVYTISI